MKDNNTIVLGIGILCESYDHSIIGTTNIHIQNIIVYVYMHNLAPYLPMVVYIPGNCLDYVNQLLLLLSATLSSLRILLCQHVGQSSMYSTGNIYLIDKFSNNVNLW